MYLHRLCLLPPPYGPRVPHPPAPDTPKEGHGQRNTWAAVHGQFLLHLSSVLQARGQSGSRVP